MIYLFVKWLAVIYGVVIILQMILASGVKISVILRSIILTGILIFILWNWNILGLTLLNVLFIYCASLFIINGFGSLVKKIFKRKRRDIDLDLFE